MLAIRIRCVLIGGRRLVEWIIFESKLLDVKSGKSKARNPEKRPSRGNRLGHTKSALCYN